MNMPSLGHKKIRKRGTYYVKYIAPSTLTCYCCWCSINILNETHKELFCQDWCKLVLSLSLGLSQQTKASLGWTTKMKGSRFFKWPLKGNVPHFCFDCVHQKDTTKGSPVLVSDTRCYGVSRQCIASSASLQIWCTFGCGNVAEPRGHRQSLPFDRLTAQKSEIWMGGKMRMI